VTDLSPVVAEQTHGVDRTPEAEHLNLLWKLARLTTHTEMVPKGLRGRPDAALAVMVYGHELGLRPMTSLREVYIIEGTPSCSAKLMRALIYRAGHALHFVEQSAQRCIVEGTRADGQGSARVTWEIADAQRAGLDTKDVWRRYPRQMLVARATSELARLIFADVTIGYTPEELMRHDLSGEYDFVDVDDIDDEIDERDARPAHEIAADMLDAEDALDAELLREAAADPDDDPEEMGG
jgi:hypothetical protein